MTRPEKAQMLSDYWENVMTSHQSGLRGAGIYDTVMAPKLQILLFFE